MSQGHVKISDTSPFPFAPLNPSDFHFSQSVERLIREAFLLEQQVRGSQSVEELETCRCDAEKRIERSLETVRLGAALLDLTQTLVGARATNFPSAFRRCLGNRIAQSLSTPAFDTRTPRTEAFGSVLQRQVAASFSERHSVRRRQLPTAVQRRLTNKPACRQTARFSLDDIRNFLGGRQEDVDTFRTRLVENPARVRSELDAYVRNLRTDLQGAYLFLIQVESELDERRNLELVLLSLLDRFFARAPGWENDDVARAMSPFLKIMPAKAIAVEDSLWSAYQTEESIVAARNRSQTALTYLSDTFELLCTVVDELIAAKTANTVEMFRLGHGTTVSADVEVRERLRSAQVAAAHANSKCRLAHLSAQTVPAVSRITAAVSRLIPYLKVRVLENAGINILTRKQIVSALDCATSAVSECEASVDYMTARERSLTLDLAHIQANAKALEKRVIRERMSVLRYIHDIHLSEVGTREGQAAVVLEGSQVTNEEDTGIPAKPS